MHKLEDEPVSTSSTTASFPPSTKSTPSRRLWVEYHECGCTFDFKKKYFGFAHWWKFTMLRHRWRLLRTSIQVYRNPNLYHGEVGDSKSGMVKNIPTVSMTNEEYDHWFKDE